MTKLSVSDQLEIREVLARVAFIHDDRLFELYSLIFTPDAKFDSSYVGGETGLRTLDEHLERIIRLVVEPGIRADHHTMNSVIVADGDNGARARSRYITHWDDGRIVTGNISTFFAERRKVGGFPCEKRFAVFLPNMGDHPPNFIEAGRSLPPETVSEFHT